VHVPHAIMGKKIAMQKHFQKKNMPNDSQKSKTKLTEEKVTDVTIKKKKND
jgi:hypothetical protein